MEKFIIVEKKLRGIDEALSSQEVLFNSFGNLPKLPIDDT